MSTAAAAVLAAAAPTLANAAAYNFNAGWKMTFGDYVGAEAPNYVDGAWKGVTLPKAFNEDEAFKKDIKDLTTGISWYRKAFTVPAVPAGGKVYLEFEGVR